MAMSSTCFDIKKHTQRSKDVKRELKKLPKQLRRGEGFSIVPTPSTARIRSTCAEHVGKYNNWGVLLDTYQNPRHCAGAGEKGCRPPPPCHRGVKPARGLDQPPPEIGPRPQRPRRRRPPRRLASSPSCYIYKFPDSGTKKETGPEN